MSGSGSASEERDACMVAVSVAALLNCISVKWPVSDGQTRSPITGPVPDHGGRLGAFQPQPVQLWQGVSVTAGHLAGPGLAARDLYPPAGEGVQGGSPLFLCFDFYLFCGLYKLQSPYFFVDF